MPVEEVPAGTRVTPITDQEAIAGAGQQQRGRLEEVEPGTPVRPVANTDIARLAARQGREAPGSFNPLMSFGQGANVGIAETAGFLVGTATGADVVNLALEGVGNMFGAGLDKAGLPGGEAVRQKLGSPVAPSRGVTNLVQGFFANLGGAPAVGEPLPDDLFSAVGRVTGGSALALLPIGPAASLSRQVTTGARALPQSAVGRAAEQVGRTALDAPLRFLGFETGAAVAAGTGGFIAKERFPDSPAAEVIGQILGGIGGPLAFGATAATGRAVVRGAEKLPLAGLAIRSVRKIALGGRKRASLRLQEVARNRTRAIQQLEVEGDPPPGVNLTPAQKTGDEGLLALERSIIASNEALAGRSDDQIDEVTRAIREGIRDLGEGVPAGSATKQLQLNRDYLQGLADTRMRQAARLADERIDRLRPGASRLDANEIARQELDAAEAVLAKQQEELFLAVPEAIVVPTKKSAEILGDIIRLTPKAQLEDIPDVARKVLGEGDAAVKSLSVAELQGLRSKLLEQGRIARRDGQRNKARLTRMLAEAVRTDMMEAESPDQALQLALAFSHDLNQRFRNPTIRRILGTDSAGAPRVSPRVTLERVAGKQGPIGAEETRAVLESMGEAERLLGEAPGRSIAMRGAIEDFLKDEFQRRAVRNGAVVQAQGEAFLRNNKQQLDLFPRLRKQIEEAIEAGTAADVAQESATGLARQLKDPNVSRAAVFLAAAPDDAMRRLGKMPNPGEAMASLVREVSKDQTGGATLGLKTAFADFVLDEISRRGRETVGGVETVSGTKLARMLSEGPISEMAVALLDEDEMRRLGEITRAAIKVQGAVDAPQRLEQFTVQGPSEFASVAARVFGAQAGRKIATATGGGTVQTPGIIAGVLQKALEQITGAPAKRLLIDAIHDEDLFQALLVGADDVPRLRRHLNAWLVSIGAEEVSDEGVFDIAPPDADAGDEEGGAP